MKASVFVLLCFVTFYSFSQDLCGTKATEYDIKVLEAMRPDRNARIADQEFPRVNIPLTIHILRGNSGAGGLTNTELTDAMQLLNEAYKPINFQFFIKGDVRYIDNSGFFDFDSSNEEQLTSNNNVSNTINIYFFNSLTSNGSSLCGYAYFPSTGRDHIMMANGCAVSSTLPHEVGHYFSLYHTHGKTNTGSTDELVDGTNCSETGDDVCDTPADPNLSGNVNGANCAYQGDETDSNGDLYRPFPKNIMSYSLSSCRNQFTEGQYQRIVNAYNTFKTYLATDLLKPELKVSETYVCTGENVVFENISESYTAMQWEFEGAMPSFSENVTETVTYNSPGQYNVKLTISDDEGNTEELLLENYIEVVNDATDLSEGIVKGSFEESTLKETIIDLDDDVTFSLTSRSSTDGSKSILMELHNYAAKGERDYVLLSSFNSELNKVYEVEFNYAYAQYGDSNDGLRVVYRNSCGEWVPVWEKYGNELSTAGDQRYFFVPNQNQWKREVIEFIIPEEMNQFDLAFESINDFGNNLYIDDYKIQSVDTTYRIEEILVSQSTCNDSDDGVIEIVVSGDGTFEYSIDGETFIDNNIFNEVAPGEYDVLVRKLENGTVQDEVVKVHFDNTTPKKPEISQVGDFLQVSVAPGQTIRWFLDGELIEGVTTSSLSNPGKGLYEVELLAGSCSSLSDPFLVLSSTDSNNKVEMYPNPVDDFLTVQYENSQHNVMIEIISMSGRLLHKVQNHGVIDVSHLSPGLYLVRLNVGNEIFEKKIIKR